MSKVVKFEEVVKRMSMEIPGPLRNAEILPDVELAWQTAAVNIQKEGDNSVDSGVLVSLNRFFEFDAAKHQPIFKAVSVDYDACRKRLVDIIVPSGPIWAPIPKFIGLLLGEGGKSRNACLNIASADDRLYSTSWAVDCGHLSTIVMVANWDLWRDAICDIEVVFLAHLAIAQLLQIEPGPISFVCNRITLHIEDIPTVNNAISSFRSIVQMHANVDYIMNCWKIINADPIVQERDESEDVFAERLKADIDAREKAQEALIKMDEESPLDGDMFDIYNTRFKLSLGEDSPKLIRDAVDIMRGLQFPTTSAVDSAPVAPI